MAFIAIQRLPGEELESVRRLREAGEGGPGSGPHKGEGLKSKSTEELQEMLNRAHAKVKTTEGDLKLAAKMKDPDLLNKRSMELEDARKLRSAVKSEIDSRHGSKEAGVKGMRWGVHIQRGDKGTYSPKTFDSMQDAQTHAEELKQEPGTKATVVKGRFKSQEAGVKGMHWGQHLEQHIDNLTKSMQSTKDPAARRVLQAKVDKIRDAMTSDLERRLGEANRKRGKFHEL